MNDHLFPEMAIGEYWQEDSRSVRASTWRRPPPLPSPAHALRLRRSRRCWGEFSDARTLASRVNRAMRSRSAANSSGSTLMATFAPQFGVGGAIDGPHAAFAEFAGNAVVRDGLRDGGR